MDNPISLPQYRECYSCIQIVPLSELDNDNGTPKCPYCSYEKEGIPWPKEEIQELLKFALNYDRKAPRYNQLVCVFLSSALEIILERLLWNMAIWYEDLWWEEVASLVGLLMKSYQGRSRMVALYSKLGENTLARDIKKLGHKSFYKTWDKVVQARNNAVHGRSYSPIAVSPEFTLSFVEEILQIFSKLHNKYNQTTQRYKIATGQIKKLEQEKAKNEELQRLQKWIKQVTGDIEA